jgi:hypothetical protein
LGGYKGQSIDSREIYVREKVKEIYQEQQVTLEHQNIQIVRKIAIRRCINHSTKKIKYFLPLSIESLLIFFYDNCIRQLFLSIIKEDYYQEVIRFRFFILYVALNVIGCCAFSFKAYYIMSIVLECLVLVDAVMGIIALRVFGEFSYTENKIMAVLHVLSVFVVIVLSML